MSSVKTTVKTSEGPTSSSSVKTTTYESRTSYESEQPRSYRSLMGPRTTVITRSSYGGGGGGGGMSGMSRSQQQSMQYANLNPINAGALQAIAATGVTSVKTARQGEKKDMQDLNERFASYIEKVRFLEAQNRKLADELDKLKSKWGKETTAIKAMYQAELDEARRLLDDSEKDKARLEIRVDSLEEQLEEAKKKIEDLVEARNADREIIERQNQQLSDYEAEINLLRRRVEVLESDRDRDRKEIARLTEALNRARIDLDNETLSHIDAENRRQTLEEELEFLKQVHDQEMKELAALAYRDTTQENREFWKNEMGAALREIQVCYDEKLDTMRGDLETYYNMKVQEFRTGATRQNMESVHSKEETKRLKSQVNDLRAKLAELETRNAMLEKELELLKREYEEKEREWEHENTELKNEVAKLRAEMEAILKELQEIMDTKLGLELEIAAYRKLLEGEENRIGLRSVVSGFLSSSSGGGGGGGGGEGFEVSGGGGGSGGGGFSSSSGGGGGGGGFSSSSGGGGGGFSMSSSSGGGGGGFSSSGGQWQEGGDDSSLKVSQVVKGEMSAKTTYQRSAKGPVTISECSADGKFITIENTSRKDEGLGGWKIDRNIDGAQKPSYIFDQAFSVRGNGKFKIWSGQKPGNAAREDLDFPSEQSWGIGANITTKLINPAGEDRATHIQKTVYTSN